MNAEQLLEELMVMNGEEQQRFFQLVRERPALRRALDGVAEPSPELPEVAPTLDSSADYLIIFDGGSKGNPGKGYGSYQLTAVRNGKSRVEKLEFPGRMTNNEAEYETLIGALDTLATKIRERGKEPKEYKLDIRGDSLLVINQVLGKWKAKDDRMAVYRDRVRALLKQFGRYTLTHHDRSKSVAALGH